MMKIVGGLYCVDGNVNSVKDQSQYVVGVNEVDKEHMREACMAYIDDYFGKDYFEKERGISLKKWLILRHSVFHMNVVFP